MMNNSYKKLKNIWHACPVKGVNSLLEIIPLLENNGVKLRQHDGILEQITLSKPTVKENYFVIGLRYIKNDSSFTEDHFSCEKGNTGLRGQEIIYHPKRKLENLIYEYKGTHKEVPIYTNQDTKIVTDVSTHTYFLESY